MDGRGKGITARGNSIQIDFYFRGMRCRETLKLPPTKANLKYAAGMKVSIEHEIAIGVFNYAKYFPESKNARLGSTGANKSIEKALDEFLEASRKRCSPSTWRGYRSIVEHHLKPAFGHFMLTTITSADIKLWVSSLNVSNKRINNALTPLRTILADAFSDGLIERNPIDRIKNLPNRFDEPDPFTPDEVAKILKELPDQASHFFQFAFWTGMRTSELIAVEWGDIDWNKGTVRVRRAFVEKQIKETKTLSGEREIKLFPPALEALTKQKSHTYLQGKRIFHNPRTNKPWDNDGQIRKTAWIPALRRAGVIYRNPYQTRHTYASTLLSAGENPLWVAQQMGHKDWGMIRKRYGRWIPDVDTSAGGKVMQFWTQNSHKDIAND